MRVRLTISAACAQKLRPTGWAESAYQHRALNLTVRTPSAKAVWGIIINMTPARDPKQVFFSFTWLWARRPSHLQTLSVSSFHAKMQASGSQRSAPDGAKRHSCKSCFWPILDDFGRFWIQTLCLCYAYAFSSFLHRTSTEIHENP